MNNPTGPEDGRANRKICVTLLRYSMDTPERSYAQVRLFARKKQEENFQQKVYVNNKDEKLFHLPDIMKSVSYKVLAEKPFVVSYAKLQHLFTLYRFSCCPSQDELEPWR